MEISSAAALLRRWFLDESGAAAAARVGVVVLALLFICLISNYIKRRRREAQEQAAAKLRIERGERGCFFELSSTGDLAPHYDVVVIGSGYGAGCAALRFAQATKKSGPNKSQRSLRVAVLERGRELLPGSFPETAEAALEHVHVTLHNRDPAGPAGPRPPIEAGSRLALVDIRVFQDVMVVQGCGLGGTSLINANVVIEADQRIYNSDRWPEAIRQDFSKGDNAERPMDQYFDRARKQIGAATYPDNWPQLTKLEALKYATKRVSNDLGRPVPLVQGTANLAGGQHHHRLTWEKTPIAVSFEERAHTKTGYVQPPCNLCGNCCSGCNTGAKNTVNTNYIADAWAHGADIFTGLTVMRVEKAPKRADGTHGYVVYYKPTDEMAEPDTWRAAGDRFVLADRVVLGAGSLGSTEILLRSAAGKLPLSKMLGHHYSGNGDSIGAATGITRKVASFGNSVSTNVAQDNNFAVGPCITSVTKVVEIEDLGASLDFVVEDCSVPGVLRGVSNTAVRGEAFIRAVRQAHSAQCHPNGIQAAVLNPARRLLPRVRRGPSDHIEPFLVMSHDDSKKTGTMSLEGDDDTDKHLVLNWPTASQDRAYPHSDSVLRQLGTALEQDDFVGNPAIDALQRGISVHPLGGCCMGDSRDNGVVNHCGQVFDASAANDTDVHAGLYCVDGSIVPTSLGINPLLTITALAERCMSRATSELDLTPGAEQAMLPAQQLRPPPGPVDPRLTEARTMLTFTERMTGSVAQRTPSSDTCNGDTTDLSFVLAVTFKSLEKLTTDPATLGKLSGTVSWGQRCLSVCSGDFRLFEPDPLVVAGMRMVYTFVMVTAANERYKFVGYKAVERRRYSSFLPLDLWAGTTTLHVTITSEADPAQQWRGTLTIHLTDLLTQIRTMRAWRVGALIRRSTWTELFTFLSIFATQAWRVYWRLSCGERLKGPVAPLRMVGQQTISYSSRAEGEERADGLFQPMQFYPSTAGAADAQSTPVVLLHGMAVSSEIFSLVTVDVNLVEHLTAHGFDVYVPELRMSTAVPEMVSTQNGTFDLDTIATQDVPGAVADACAHFAERRALNVDDLRANVLGHCAGGAALAIALLHEKCEHMRARLSKVAFSQVSIFSEPAPFNSVKAELRLSSILSFAPLLLVLAVGAMGFALCALALHYWYTAAQWVVLAGFAVGGSLMWWAVSRVCWRLGGIDPGSYHWPPFDWAVRAWVWMLTRGSPQRCSQGCCHWITFLYGLLYQHNNLNHETHAAMPSLFGFGGMRLFDQLAASCRRRCVAPYSEEHLRQAIEKFVHTQVPLLVVHGSENRCWSAGGAQRTVETLKRTATASELDPSIYELNDVAGYGHLDCIFGKAAAEIVFPLFSAFFRG